MGLCVFGCLGARVCLCVSVFPNLRACGLRVCGFVSVCLFVYLGGCVFAPKKTHSRLVFSVKDQANPRVPRKNYLRQ